MFGTFTYLGFELIWAIPILLLQWAIGWRTLWRNLRVLAMGVVFVTAYLSAADGVAIAAKIWRLHHDRIVGVYVGNVPIEEVLFFLFTNALVIQALLLLLDPDTQQRARAIFASLLPGGRRMPSRT